MTRRRRRRSLRKQDWRNAGVALLIATCVGTLGHVADARIERQDLRAERARLQGIAAERARLDAAPTSEWFTYLSVRPIQEYVPLDKPVAMQSEAVVLTTGELQHDDRLRCWPLDDEGNLGRGRLLPRTLDVVTLDQPRIYGPVRPEKLPKGFVWHDGEWVFPGDRPDVESDCVMISRPCVEPVADLKKCQIIESGWIRFREIVPE